MIWSHLAGRDLDLEASKLAPFFGIRPDLSAPLRRAEDYCGADLGKEARPERRNEGRFVFLMDFLRLWGAQGSCL